MKLAVAILLFSLGLAACGGLQSQKTSDTDSFDSLKSWNKSLDRSLVLHCRHVAGDGSAIYIAVINDSKMAPREMHASSKYRSAGRTIYQETKIIVTNYGPNGHVLARQALNGDYFRSSGSAVDNDPSTQPYASDDISVKGVTAFEFRKDASTNQKILSFGPEQIGLPLHAEMECK